MDEIFLRLYEFLQLPISIISTVGITLYILRKCIHKTKGVCTCKTTLVGKIALITGGTSGLGLETAKDLALRGAKVIVASIDVTHEAAVKDIITTSGNKHVEYMYLDLSKFSSIRGFVDKFKKKFDRLDILVNNAGCNLLKHKISEDGNEMTMQINYLGPFLLTNMLLEKLNSSKPSRIVMVSSLAHKFANLDVEDLSQVKSKNLYTKYANSKYCIILWAKALAKKLPEGITANAVHPGLSKTNIFQKFYPFLRFIILFIVGFLFKTAKEGAQTTIHVCIDPNLEKISGGYFSECKQVQCQFHKENELIDAVWNKSVLLTNSDITI